MAASLTPKMCRDENAERLQAGLAATRSPDSEKPAAATRELACRGHRRDDAVVGVGIADHRVADEVEGPLQEHGRRLPDRARAPRSAKSASIVTTIGSLIRVSHCAAARSKAASAPGFASVPRRTSAVSKPPEELERARLPPCRVEHGCVTSSGAGCAGVIAVAHAVWSSPARAGGGRQHREHDRRDTEPVCVESQGSAPDRRHERSIARRTNASRSSPTHRAARRVRRTGRARGQRRSYASSRGAAISSRKRSNVHGHTAGMPRSSRYQLRQPVTHTVCCAASRARPRSAAIAVARGADLAALARAEALDELHDVARTAARRPRSARSCPTGPFGPFSMKKFGKSGIEIDRYALGRCGPGVVERHAVAARSMSIGRMNAIGLEAGREHEHVELVQHAVARCARRAGSTRSMPSVTSSALRPLDRLVEVGRDDQALARGAIVGPQPLAQLRVAHAVLEVRDGTRLRSSASAASRRRRRRSRRRRRTAATSRRAAARDRLGVRAERGLLLVGVGRVLLRHDPLRRALEERRARRPGRRAPRRSAPPSSRCR